MGVLRRARRRRIIGAGILGGAAYHMGKNAGKNEEAAAQNEDEQQNSDANINDSQFDQLEKLGKLHESGVLTDEEFAAEKKKLLE